MAKIGNFYRWIYGHITSKPTNFNWVIEGKLAGSGLPTSSKEIRWLAFKYSTSLEFIPDCVL